MVTPGIVDWCESEMGFYVDRFWEDGRWRLEQGPIRLAQYHADILAHVFTADESGRLPYDVCAWCEPAKSGKSAVAGLAALYAGLHLDGDVVMASNKRDQAASVMFKSLTEAIRANPHLRRLEPGKYEVEFKSGNVAKAIPSNSRGEAGARFSLFVADELWGYIHQDATRLWSEFKTDPTRLSSMRMAVGYAGYMESTLWLEQLNTGLAGEPVPELAHIVNADATPCCWHNGRHFTFWSHVCRQPWQTAAWIEAQRKSLREPEFRRMILTEFVEGEGDFLPIEAWRALIDPEHTVLAPGSHLPVYVGLDIATKPGGDDCALIGVYPDGGKVKVAFHKVWRGGASRRRALKLSETVEPYLRAAARDYRLAGVWFDPYQALDLADRLRRAGIHCIEVPQSHATRGPKDTELQQMAIDGELVLYNDPELREAAANASARELENGLLFLRKSGRGKIDLLVALSNCANEARTRHNTGWVGTVGADLSWTGFVDGEGNFRFVGHDDSDGEPDPRRPMRMRVERYQYHDTL